MKIFIDLDNTLCYTNGSDYNSSEPIQHRIDKVNALEKTG